MLLSSVWIPKTRKLAHDLVPDAADFTGTRPKDCHKLPIKAIDCASSDPFERLLDQILYKLEKDGKRIPKHTGLGKQKNEPASKYQLRDYDGRTIVAVDTIESAEALCRKLRKKFPRSERIFRAVHSRSSEAYREELVSRRCETCGCSRVIISPGAYLKGLQHHNIGHVIIYKFPTMKDTTLTDLTQMLGRSGGIFRDTRRTILLHDDASQKQVFDALKDAIKTDLEAEDPATGECPRPALRCYYIEEDDYLLMGGRVPDSDYSDMDSAWETDDDAEEEGSDDIGQDDEGGDEATKKQAVGGEGNHGGNAGGGRGDEIQA